VSDGDAGTPPPGGPAERAWRQLAPSLRGALTVVALFALAMLLVHEYEAAASRLVEGHVALAAVAFFVTSVAAVLLPMLTNLPLVPLAVLAFGPGWTALLLLAGWIAGASLSFLLARHAQRAVLRRFPAVQRHADIDRLIHPQHRLTSLVLLRMTFPVDVLSYALGLFSRATRLREVALSTALGAAPFALGFAYLPLLSPAAQLAVLALGAAAFAVYASWMLGGGAAR
jgi:uncharacterized membrane protein YdjX (TVP38/TMEM64 family)